MNSDAEATDVPLAHLIKSAAVNYLINDRSRIRGWCSRLFAPLTRGEIKKELAVGLDRQLLRRWRRSEIGRHLFLDRRGGADWNAQLLYTYGTVYTSSYEHGTIYACIWHLVHGDGVVVQT